MSDRVRGHHRTLDRKPIARAVEGRRERCTGRPSLVANGSHTMPYETITKPGAGDLKVRPNLHDYEAQRASFSWDELAKELDGLPGGGLNIAYEAIDRHVAHGKGSKPAVLWEGKDGAQETYSFEDLSKLSNKWCNVLRNLGIKKGDR